MMDYEFLRDVTGVVKVRMSMGHEVVGHWFNEEVKENPVDDESPKRETSQAIKSIFEDLDENERYAVYKVHIVTENDTVETVIDKYGIAKNDLEAYNDLTDLKIGDKLIIPFHED